MDATGKALAVFKNYNCCQSVLCAFSDELGLSESTCLKLGAAFGRGMNSGDKCGAIIGAYMVIGLKTTGIENEELKQKANDVMLRFNERFIAVQGSLQCKELLGVNVSTQRGKRIAKERDLFNRFCPRFVESAVTILDDELAEKKKGA